MSALPLEEIYSVYKDDISALFPNAFERTKANMEGARVSNASFMINVTVKGMNNTHLSSLTPEMLVSDDIDSESETVETETLIFERFKRISAEHAAEKKARKEAGVNFTAIRDCYGVVDCISTDEKSKKIVFEARIYKNLSNEFVEIIRAPVTAFKKSDADLLSEGSVFYWKVGYISTSKGNRVKINEFNLRRIIREKSILRTKRVEKVVDDLLSIFK